MPDLWPYNPFSMKQICQLRTQQVNGCLGTAAAAAPLNVLQEDLQQTLIALHCQRFQQTCSLQQLQRFQQGFIGTGSTFSTPALPCINSVFSMLLLLGGNVFIQQCIKWAVEPTGSCETSGLQCTCNCYK